MSNFTGLNPLKFSQAHRQKGQESLQTIRTTPKNQDRDRTAIQLLLEPDALIRSDQSIEVSSFQSIQQLSVLQPGKTCVPDRPDFVSR